MAKRTETNSLLKLRKGDIVAKRVGGDLQMIEIRSAGSKSIGTTQLSNGFRTNNAPESFTTAKCFIVTAKTAADFDEAQRRINRIADNDRSRAAYYELVASTIASHA